MTKHVLYLTGNHKEPSLRPSKDQTGSVMLCSFAEVSNKTRIFNERKGVGVVPICFMLEKKSGNIFSKAKIWLASSQRKKCQITKKYLFLWFKYLYKINEQLFFNDLF